MKEFKLLKKQAEAGDAHAQLRLGDIYYYGDCAMENHLEAVKWYTLAAENGYVKAQYELSSIYKLGTGIQINNAKALVWLGRAERVSHVQQVIGIQIL